MAASVYFLQFGHSAKGIYRSDMHPLHACLPKIIFGGRGEGMVRSVRTLTEQQTKETNKTRTAHVASQKWPNSEQYCNTNTRRLKGKKNQVQTILVHALLLLPSQHVCRAGDAIQVDTVCNSLVDRSLHDCIWSPPLCDQLFSSYPVMASSDRSTCKQTKKQSATR